MKQEAAATACKLMNILQMLRQGPEKTTQGTGMSHWVTSAVWLILFISLWVTSVKSSPGLFILLLCLPSVPRLPAQRVVEAAGLRRRVSEECRVSNQSALQWFLLFGVCVFPEKLLVCRLPPVLFLQHTEMLSLTHTHTHTHKHTQMYPECKFMWVQCTGLQPKSSLNQMIWALQPKMNHEVWEHNTKLEGTTTMTAFKIVGRSDGEVFGHYRQWTN